MGDAVRDRSSRARLAAAAIVGRSRSSSRTPYGKQDAAQDYRTHVEAVKRGYVVVLRDVRGRYASDGIFTAYRNEGADGYDTIEWAARLVLSERIHQQSEGNASAAHAFVACRIMLLR